MENFGEDVPLASDEVHDVVEILIRDIYLTENKIKFCGCIGLLETEFPDAGMGMIYHILGESYGFFRKCLILWIARYSEDATVSNLIYRLRRSEFNAVAEKLKEWNSNNRHIRDPLNRGKWLSEIHPANHELEKIYPRRQGDSLLTDTISKFFVRDTTLVLSGPPGIGKRTTAFWYASVYALTLYNCLIWFDCINSIIMEKRVHTVATRLLIPLTEENDRGKTISKSMSQLMRQIYSTLEREYGYCLMIFENVSSVKEILPFLPRSEIRRHHSIILSISPGINVFKSYKLEKMESSEIHDLFGKWFKLSPEDLQNREDIWKLAPLLNDTPIIFDLILISITTSRSIHLRNYLSSMERLNTTHSFTNTQQNQAAKIDAALEVTLSYLERHHYSVLEALYVISMLNITDIPYDIFECIQNCSNLGSTVFRNLQEVGIIKRLSAPLEATLYRIHPCLLEILQRRIHSLPKDLSIGVATTGLDLGLGLAKSTKANIVSDSFRTTLWKILTVDYDLFFNDLNIRITSAQYFDPKFCLKKISDPTITNHYNRRTLAGIKFFMMQTSSAYLLAVLPMAFGSFPLASPLIQASLKDKNLTLIWFSIPIAIILPFYAFFIPFLYCHKGKLLLEIILVIGWFTVIFRNSIPFSTTPTYQIVSSILQFILSFCWLTICFSYSILYAPTRWRFVGTLLLILFTLTACDYALVSFLLLVEGKHIELQPYPPESFTLILTIIPGVWLIAYIYYHPNRFWIHMCRKTLCGK